MRRPVLLALIALLILPVGGVSSPLGPKEAAAASPGTFTVTVQVVDTNGLNLDGVVIVVINLDDSAVVAKGITVGGAFTATVAIVNNALGYSVSASDQVQTKQQTFTATDASNLYFSFTLVRSLAQAQLALTSVSVVPNSQWSAASGKFVITNTGQVNITSASIQFNSSTPLSVVGSGSLFSLGTLAVGSNTTLAVSFAVQPLANAGVYSIPYVLSYTDVYGRNFTTSGGFGFDLNRLTVIGSSQLVLSSITYALQQNGSGYTVAARFVFANAGQTNVTSSSIKFNATSPLTVLGSGSLISLGVIPVGTNRTLRVNFAVQPQASPGVYSIPYVLSFTDFYGRNFTTSGSFGFNLDRLLGASQLVISSLSYTIHRATNAYTIVASIVIANTGQTNVTSASIKFNSTFPLTVLGSGTQFALGPISVRSNRTLNVSFALQPRANEGVFSVPYTLNYTSGASSGSETGSISFLVNGAPDVQIASATLSSTKVTPGQSSVLVVNLENIGDEQALDVRVQLGGMSPALSSNSTYVGIILSGANASTSFGLNLPSSISVGPHSLLLALSYQDVTGKVYNATQSFSFNVFAGGIPEVKVQNILTDPVVLTAGTSGLMTIYLVNVGGQSAQNIIAQVSGAQDILASQDFSVGVIGPNSTVTTILGVNINPSITTGSHLLRIDLTYTNLLGQNFNQSSFVDVTIYPVSSFLTPVNEVIIGGVAAGVVAVVILARKLNIRI